MTIPPGGVASPTDRLENLQFSEEELRAIVEEANNAGVYCAAHAYTDEAVRRAVRCGVKSIEHGNYASAESLRDLRRAGGFLVPTLVTYQRLVKDGVEGGMAPELVAKIGDLVEAGQRTLAAAKAENVDVCYGSDLLGAMHGWRGPPCSLTSFFFFIPRTIHSGPTRPVYVFRRL